MSEKPSVVICINRRLGISSRSCADSGSEAMADELERQLAKAGLAVEVQRIECL